MTIYQIPGWDDNFENNKSREIDECSYVAMPNKQHGMGLTRILALPDGAAVFGIWCLILQATSRQRLPRDGWLTDNGAPDGLAWDIEDMALRWRRPAEEIRRAIEFLCSPKVGWLRAYEELPEKYRRGADAVPPDCPRGAGEVPANHPRRKEGKEGREGKEGSASTPTPPPPGTELLTKALQAAKADTKPEALAEWIELTTNDCECEDDTEAAEAVVWLIAKAKGAGERPRYSREVAPFVSAWKVHRKDRQWRPGPKVGEVGARAQ